MEQTQHQYQVICLWQESSDLFLEDPALLPLAPLAATSESTGILQQVVNRLNLLEPERRAEVSSYTQILAGLKFKKDVIQQLFREDLMQESVIYQDILEKGLQKGQRLLVLRLLARRLGAIPVLIQAQIETLSLEQLEALGDALLDFSDTAELESWLNTRL